MKIRRFDAAARCNQSRPAGRSGNRTGQLTFWRRVGAWVDRSVPKEGLAAQIFFTISVVLGTALCFGFRPVLTGFREWLLWRLALSWKYAGIERLPLRAARRPEKCFVAPGWSAPFLQPSGFPT